MNRMAGKFRAGQGPGLVHYAPRLNRMWTKCNRAFLRVVDLLKPRGGVKICVGYYDDDVSLES
jgi:hypothetical protein